MTISKRCLICGEICNGEVEGLVSVKRLAFSTNVCKFSCHSLCALGNDIHGDVYIVMSVSNVIHHLVSTILQPCAHTACLQLTLCVSHVCIPVLILCVSLFTGLLAGCLWL